MVLKEIMTDLVNNKVDVNGAQSAPYLVHRLNIAIKGDGGIKYW